MAAGPPWESHQLLSVIHIETGILHRVLEAENLCDKTAHLDFFQHVKLEFYSLDRNLRNPLTMVFLHASERTQSSGAAYPVRREKLLHKL